MNSRNNTLPETNFDKIKKLMLLFISWCKNLPQNYQITKNKLSDIAQTNYDLAKYHFEKNNLNDAILRFKLLRKFSTRYQDVNYYIGRCYLEKFKYSDATRYLEEYRNSDDMTFKEESMYCLNIATYNTKAISTIPESIIVRKFDTSLNRLNTINSELEEPNKSQLIDMIFNQLQKDGKLFSNNTLDLGYGVGILGKILKQKKMTNTIIGVEISPKIAAQARTCSVEGGKVYDMVLNQSAKEFLISPPQDRYDIIIASDLISYFPDLQLFFSEAYKIINEKGILGIVFAEVEDGNVNFNGARECFEYSAEYVKHNAIQNNWLVVAQQSVILGNEENGIALLFAKLK